MVYRISTALIFSIICFSMWHSASAQELRFDSLHRGQREISILAGYGENHKIPSCTKDRFSFDIAKFRYGVFTSPRTQVGFCLSLGKQEGDIDNSAVYATVGYRRYFMVRGNTALGYDMNIGLMHMQHDIRELGTTTNFHEQLGLTFQHSTSDSTAYTIEYVFSHTSNADIKLPNIGLNTSMIAIGYSWFR